MKYHYYNILQKFFLIKKAQEGHWIFAVNMGKNEIQKRKKEKGEDENDGIFLVLRRKTGFGLIIPFSSGLATRNAGLQSSVNDCAATCLVIDR